MNAADPSAMPSPGNQRIGPLALPRIPLAKLGSSAWLLHLRSFAVVGQLITVLVTGGVIGVDLRLIPLLSLVALTAGLAFFLFTALFDLGLALLVQVSEKGARDLYGASVANTGGRIVLSVNGNAIGARRIHAPIQDGNLYTFVELPDDALGDLVLELKDSLAQIQAAEK